MHNDSCIYMPFSLIASHQIQRSLKSMGTVAFSSKGLEVVFIDKYLSMALCTPGLEMARTKTRPRLIILLYIVSQTKITCLYGRPNFSSGLSKLVCLRQWGDAGWNVNFSANLCYRGRNVSLSIHLHSGSSCHGPALHPANKIQVSP